VKTSIHGLLAALIALFGHSLLKLSYQYRQSLLHCVPKMHITSLAAAAALLLPLAAASPFPQQSPTGESFQSWLLHMCD
jgi:hypothetical protein